MAEFNKAAHRRQHANQRAAQRYQLRPTPKDYEDLRAQVVQGKAALVEDQVLRGIYEAQLNGQKVWVVYHKIKRRIVTFLPKNPREAKP